jgi:uncharacterized NAD(P)/FAD-binding protein YdhS
MKTVCIIGGGFSGMFTAIHLLRKDVKLKLKLFNDDYPLALGAAYSTLHREHLLNVAAGKMSPYKDRPSHFADWILSKKEYSSYHSGGHESKFLPRFIYGKYLDEIISDFISDERLEIIHSRVVDVDQENGQYLVGTASQKTFVGDFLVLANGNFAPAPPKLNDLSFIKNTNYFPNPWKFNKKTDPEKSVLIIGSGLTMIDQVLTLLSDGFTGEIYSVSPRGYFPQSHAENQDSYPDFYDELEHKSLQSVFQTVIKHLKNAGENGISWQAVIDSVRPHARSLWLNFSEKDKTQFVSHLRHIWGVARHRLPREVFVKIRQLISEGKLQIIAGRLQSVTEEKDGFKISIRQRRTGQLKTVIVSSIVNCTGPQTNFNELNDDLIRNLIHKNIIAPHELKIGIRALPDGMVLNAENKVVPNVYAVGSLLRGVLWENTAVPELRLNAENVALQIIGSIN